MKKGFELAIRIFTGIVLVVVLVVVAIVLVNNCIQLIKITF